MNRSISGLSRWAWLLCIACVSHVPLVRAADLPSDARVWVYGMDTPWSSRITDDLVDAVFVTCDLDVQQTARVADLIAEHESRFAGTLDQAASEVEDARETWKAAQRDPLGASISPQIAMAEYDRITAQWAVELDRIDDATMDTIGDVLDPRQRPAYDALLRDARRERTMGWSTMTAMPYARLYLSDILREAEIETADIEDAALFEELFSAYEREFDRVLTLLGEYLTRTARESGERRLQKFQVLEAYIIRLNAADDEQAFLARNPTPAEMEERETLRRKREQFTRHRAVATLNRDYGRAIATTLAADARAGFDHTLMLHALPRLRMDDYRQVHSLIASLDEREGLSDEQRALIDGLIGDYTLRSRDLHTSIVTATFALQEARAATVERGEWADEAQRVDDLWTQRERLEAEYVREIIRLLPNDASPE